METPARLVSPPCLDPSCKRRGLLQDIAHQEDEGSSPEEPQQEAVAAVSAPRVPSWGDEGPREIVEFAPSVSWQRSG